MVDGQCGQRGHGAVQTVDDTDDADVTVQRRLPAVITAPVLISTLSSARSTFTQTALSHTVRSLHAASY